MRPIDAGPDARRPPRGFALGQRRALVGLVAIFLICIVVGLLRNPSFVDDPMPDAAPLGDALLDRLDPNVAEARQLAALPGLGVKRANDIVAYRERTRSRPAFRVAEDLLRIDGIGVSIVAQLRPFLSFPAPATTQASP